METAAFQARIAREKIAESERRLTLEVTLACIDVMEAKARLALANDNLQALERLVSLNQNRVDAGAAAPVELTRSRVAMLQFRAGVKTAELALNSARLKLQALIGRRTSSPLVDISDDMAITLPAASPNLDRLLEIAYTARPEIRTVQLDQARSQADLRLQLAQGKVDYTFGAEYRRQQGVNGRGNSLGFFVSAPLPVFNRNQGEIARVHAEQEQIRQALEALRMQVSSEVSSAWQDFDTTRTLLQEIERDLLGPSREARNTTAYVYQAGASSLIDVLDAQRAFNETMSTYYGAQADYRRAATRLAAAAGQEIVP
jgi:cobalt-zinc-cadmium efflux system outer membrane protein